jgi:hypothetical protein
MKKIYLDGQMYIEIVSKLSVDVKFILKLSKFFSGLEVLNLTLFPEVTRSMLL